MDWNLEVRRIWPFPRRCVVCGRRLTPGQRYVRIRQQEQPYAALYVVGWLGTCLGCAKRLRQLSERGESIPSIIWGDTPKAD